jgi:hypothetical protein
MLTKNLKKYCRSCRKENIGMYGYNFLEGGEKAYQLVATREWLDLVKDSLIHNILCMVSIVIGGCTGISAIITQDYLCLDSISTQIPALLSGGLCKWCNFQSHSFAWCGGWCCDHNHAHLSQEMRERQVGNLYQSRPLLILLFLLADFCPL